MDTPSYRVTTKKDIKKINKMRESESVFLKCRLQSRSRHFENADSGVGSRSRHFQNADSGVESRSRHFKKADSGVESRSRHFSKCRLRSRESESAFFKMPTPESGVGVGLNSSDSPALAWITSTNVIYSAIRRTS